jgi:hypothetical protein
MTIQMLPLQPEHFELPDEELGKLILGLWIMDHAKTVGFDPSNVPLEAGRIIVQATQELPDEHVIGTETDSLFMAVRLAANGKFAAAGKKLKSHFQHRVLHEGALNEALHGKSRQRQNARMPRPDALQELIIAILKAKPGLTESQLLRELENNQWHGVIEEIDGAVIIFNDKGRLKEAPISGLKDRISRARKKANSR